MISFLRYSKLVLMDATYRTCKVALPLFFLVVKTNIGYQCVGSFIIHTEDQKSIAEALRVIRDYLIGKGVQMQSFMVDCSPAEIGAIREVYPGESTVAGITESVVCGAVLGCEVMVVLKISVRGIDHRAV